VCNQNPLDIPTPSPGCLLQSIKRLEQLAHKGNTVRTKVLKALRLAAVQVQTRFQLSVQKCSFDVQLPNKHLSMSDGSQEHPKTCFRGDRGIYVMKIQPRTLQKATYHKTCLEAYRTINPNLLHK